MVRKASRLRLVRENLRDNKAAYERDLKRILARADILDAEAIVSLRQLIREMQTRVGERISSELVAGGADTNWNSFWVSRLNGAITNVVKELSEKAGAELGRFILDSWKLGSEMVDTSIRAFSGLEIMSPSISAYALTTLAPYSAKLITRIDEVTRDAVDKTLKVSIALGESPGQLMAKLQRDLMDQPSPWRSVVYRSEVVARTEISRTQTLASEARIKQAQLEFPELEDEGLKQIFVSVTRGEWPCKICQPYDQTVWDIGDKKKPMPPMHPNCRCVMAPYFPGFSSPPIPPSERQSDVSIVSECVCCE